MQNLKSFTLNIYSKVYSIVPIIDLPMLWLLENLTN